MVISNFVLLWCSFWTCQDLQAQIICLQRGSKIVFVFLTKSKLFIRAAWKCKTKAKGDWMFTSKKLIWANLKLAQREHGGWRQTEDLARDKGEQTQYIHMRHAWKVEMHENTGGTNQA